MLGKFVAAGALGLLTAIALPASAADQGVSFGPGFAYSPSEVHIVAGESVTFTPSANHDFDASAPAGPQHHPLDFEDASIPDQTSGTSAVTRTFAQPGTYVFFCRIHRAQGMEGRVIVDAPPAPSPGSTTSGTTTSSSSSTTAIGMTTSQTTADGTTTSFSQTSVTSTSSDGTAPKVTIKQTVVNGLSSHVTVLQFTANEPGTASASLTARGAVVARGAKTFKKAGAQSLRLKPTTAGRKLLRGSPHLNGKLRFTVRDVAGNTTKLTRALTISR
jgi:plastocyanin